MTKGKGPEIIINGKPKPPKFVYEGKPKGMSKAEEAKWWLQEQERWVEGRAARS